VLERVDEIAADVGRLRRRLEPESSAAFTVDRIASNIEWIAVMLEPTAASLVARTFPGDDLTVDAALDHVDQRARRLRGLLGEPTR
jgi:hypothetical protein